MTCGDVPDHVGDVAVLPHVAVDVEDDAALLRDGRCGTPGAIRQIGAE